jgi:hypothetical protein
VLPTWKETIMANEIDGAPLPPVADRDTWQAQLAELLVREKAHTREGDAIAAARRRLPMVEVESSVPLIGAQGPVRLLDVFEGRRQLIVYFHMWHTGQPAEAQCEGCTFFNGQEFGPGRGGSGEDSPADWPQRFANTGEQFRTNGRPAAQWSRLAAGRSDDLTGN